MAKPRDIVVVVGKGHEDFQEYWDGISSGGGGGRHQLWWAGRWVGEFQEYWDDISSCGGGGFSSGGGGGGFQCCDGISRGGRMGGGHSGVLTPRPLFTPGPPVGTPPPSLCSLHHPPSTLIRACPTFLPARNQVLV